MPRDERRRKRRRKEERRGAGGMNGDARIVGVESKHSRLEEESAATTGGPFGQRVFVYMPTRGINLYPVKPPAASIQRLLVSLFGYLANENYDLTSTRFYCTGTLVSPACLGLLRPPGLPGPTFSLAYAYRPTRPKLTGPSATLFPGRRRSSQ